MKNIKETLIKKIENHEIVVGVVGLGYVGLPLAVEKAKAGFKTIGFDVQQEKVDLVNQGHNYIGDVVDDDLTELVNAGRLSATSDFSFVKDVDFIAICVPTPLDSHQQPDISYVKDSTIAISKHLKPGTMVVLESTTYPGTTEELIKPILEEGSGLKISIWDFHLRGLTRETSSSRRRTLLRLSVLSVRMLQSLLLRCTVKCWSEMFMRFHHLLLPRWRKFWKTHTEILISASSMNLPFFATE